MDRWVRVKGWSDRHNEYIAESVPSSILNSLEKLQNNIVFINPLYILNPYNVYKFLKIFINS